MKPTVRPARPYFSSGPCAKRPGWSLAALEKALIGRSHRSKPGKAAINEVVSRSRAILGVPPDWKVAIVPASDTGAMEMVMWTMLGARGIDMLAWESFGQGWVTDVSKQLKLADVRVIDAPYGKLPDLATVDTDRDVVFTWNGTTSGVRVPDGSWIKADRQGLMIADATSAAFAMDLSWDKLDVVTWSWQKALGGEAAHGMLALSPRAVARLESFVPPRPLPKLFRLTSGGKFSTAIFEGETINTPSMLCVEDALDGLRWAESVGGLKGLIKRTEANAAALDAWVKRTPWAGYLAADARYRSPTSVCVTIVDPSVQALDAKAQQDFVKRLVVPLDAEGIAYDIAGHRDAPAHLRIWCGATIETSDIEALAPWLDWAWSEVTGKKQAA